MKNLLVVVRSISFGVGVGGMERAATQHIHEMHEKGYRVHLIAPRNKVSGKIPEFVEFIDVKWPSWDKYKMLMTMGVAYYTWCKLVSKEIDRIKTKIDIIHFHGASAGTLGFLDKNLLKKKVTVVNPHGMEEFGTGSILRLANRAFTRALLKKSRSADAVIATDTILIKNVKDNLDVIDEKIFVVPNTIDIEALRKIAKINKDNKSVKLVSVGRIEHNKGYDLLASALAGLVSNNKTPNNFSWNHYGKGKMKEKIIEFCKRHQVPLTVIAGASDEEVQSAIANSSIFIQPSRYEGSSLTTLEAMSHAALIVAMPVGGIPDKIFDGKTGFLCDSVTVSDLEKSISDAFSNINNSVIRDSAYEYVLQNFDISVSTKKYDELYKHISALKVFK